MIMNYIISYNLILFNLQSVDWVRFRILIVRYFFFSFFAVVPVQVGFCIFRFESRDQAKNKYNIWLPREDVSVN